MRAQLASAVVLLAACSGYSGPSAETRAERAPRPPVVVETHDDAAPVPDSAEPVIIIGWALDPATRECVPYSDPDMAPDGGPRFGSKLECHCSIESCPATIEEAAQRFCAVTSRPANAVRYVGCNMASVSDDYGYHWTFEPSVGPGAAPPRLVGATQRGDASSTDAGSPASWSAGLDPAHCDYEDPSEFCLLCGEYPVPDLPLCP